MQGSIQLETPGLRFCFMKNVQLAIKRFFDLLVSLSLIIMLSPLFVILSLVIWISMGQPVIFKQPRLGHKGRVFILFKFRTMTLEKDPHGDLLPDHRRLTGIGQFLRKTSLDELPELYNVLAGQMSIVGPRPLLVEYRDLYTAEQWRRHEMPPGMAGPVLAEGRNALSWEEKFRQDIWYIENWSLALDLIIFLKTILAVLKREGTSAKGHVTMPRFEGTKEKENHDSNTIP
jgi:sugar transferase EpsL